MLRKIYTIFIMGVTVSFTSVLANQSVTNIKKVVKKDGKIVVIVSENGKDKKLTLTPKELEKIIKSGNKDKKSDKKDKKIKNNKKKKITKNINKKSNKTKDKKVKKEVKSSADNQKSTKSKKKLTYTVSSGDTIFSIARKYKVKISDLVKLNKLENSKLIHPGDILKIPTKGYVESAKEAIKNNKKSVYVVKSGDTLYSIAKKFNMKVDKLRSLNNLKKNPKLKAGMELSVIGKEIKVQEHKNAVVVTRHVVKRGDTLWKIAKKYHLTIAQLRLLNPTIRTRGLKRGYVLNVSKKKALKLAKLSAKRKRRLKGLLSRYTQRDSKYVGGSSRRVVAYAKRFLGTRYVWGATGRGGFDCSGFTQYVMKHAKGRVIPRVSRRQAYFGRYVSRRNLRPGDLIFFDTSRRRRGYVNHVGIYIGNGYFIHASSAKHRVVITSLNKPFYRSRFMWGRRIN